MNVLCTTLRSDILVLLLILLLLVAVELLPLAVAPSIPCCQLLAKTVESAFPRRSLASQPLLCSSQHRRFELARTNPSHFLRRHDPCSLEHTEMLHDGSERHVERFGEFADRRRPTYEALDHRPSARIGQRVEQQIEVNTVNHLLNCIGTAHNSQVIT
jgi:hypothetical protein